MELYILIGAFFLISLIYSSVGFAGGSSYVALLGVMAISFEILRPTALLCNILVATGGTMIYLKEGLIQWRRSWPFLVASVPCAFVGGFWPIKEHTFFLILGVTLIIASVFLWLHLKEAESPKDAANPVVPILIGSGIGFLSGISSIGGGIFLSPILHLRNWDRAKNISALASLFILVNSISGLAGQLSRSAAIDWNFVWPLLVAVFVGGQLGSRLGVLRLNHLYIKRITAVLILIAGINILKDHW